MNGKKYFEIRKTIHLLMIAVGVFLSIRCAEECTQGIRKGILFCIEVLVPSLFLLMVLSSYIVKSGVMQTVAKPLRAPSRLLFHLPHEGLAVILLGVIGGYPVGARCAAMLYEQGDLNEEDAAKTSCIAFCAGPGFLVNYIGGALLGLPAAGWLLLASQVVGLTVTGMIIGRALPSGTAVRHARRQTAGSNLLLTSVNDASHAVFRMCAMVVLCAAMIEVVAAVSPGEQLTDIASAAIEITEGCHRMCGAYPLYIIAFFVGFGGISVHLQIYAGLGRLTVNKGLFFLFRIIQGIITAAAAYILLMIFPLKLSVFNSTDAPLTLSQSATMAGSAALILSALCFVGSIKQKNGGILCAESRDGWMKP